MKKNPTDILCLCTPHGVGGAQNNAGRLTKAFRERGYNAQLGFLFQREPEYNPPVDDYFIVSDKIPQNLSEMFGFLRRCHNEITSRRPAAAIGFHPLANIICGLATGWHTRVFSRQAWPSDQQSRLTEKLESFLTRTPLFYGNIACSYFVSSTFSHRGRAYKEKTRIIYNEPPVLPGITDTREDCRRHFGMTDTGPVLGTLGRLHEQKNFQLAVRAMRYIPSGVLYMAGGGPQERMLRELASHEGVADRVHFVGPLEGQDITRFLRAVDLLLMPSIYEGHPLVMLEAMSAGTPVIANDIAVMREAGGSDAAIYASCDPAEWGHKIQAITEAQRDQLIVAGYQRAEYFSATSMVDSYLTALGFAPYKGRVDWQ